MDVKNELLKLSGTRFETLPTNSCCCTILKADVDDKGLEFVCTLLECDDGEENFSITTNLDRLLGRWLKIKKYFDIPSDERVVAILFIQPIWINHFFRIHLHSAHQASIFVVKPQNWINFTRMSHNPKFLKPYRSTQWKPGQPRQIFIDDHFPFVFAEISDCTSPILIDSDFHGSFGTRPMTILTTSDPKIFLLIFSSVLRKGKHCAKLLRCFLKDPNHFVWSSAQPCIDVTICISAKVGQVRYSSFGIETDESHVHYYDDESIDSDILRFESMSEAEIDNDFVLKTYLDGEKFKR